MSLPAREIVEGTLPQYNKSFMGIGIGPDGVPIDLLRIHLIGSSQDNFAILIADEFASARVAGESGLNDLDLSHSLNKYLHALDVFQKVWPNPRQIILASDIMKTREYADAYREIESRIHSLGIEQQIEKIQTERGTTANDRKKYAISEFAVIEYLRKHLGYDLKIGQHSEIKYDLIMKKISPDMKFAYIHTAHALSQGSEEPSPYSIDNITAIPNKRILISDDPDTVEEKLGLGTAKALRYFAVLGSLAGRDIGKSCLVADDILKIKQDDVCSLAQTYVVDNIMAPIRRQEGKAIHRKTPMRKVYDATFQKAVFKFKKRTPNLAEVIRPELDIITGQIVYLLNERQEYGGPARYDKTFPHLDLLGINKEMPGEIYYPILKMIARKNRKAAPEGLDLEIMELLQRRILRGYDVAIAKLRAGKSVYDGKREAEVLGNAESLGKKYGIESQVLRDVFKFIMDKTKELQEILISRYELDFS